MPSKKIIKSIYGSTALLKAYCFICKAYSFIQNGVFVCCNRVYENIPKKEILKRESAGQRNRKRLPKKVKNRILEAQNHKCIYCDIDLNDKYVWDNKRAKFIKIKVHFDHFVSWNYSRSDQASNLVAACHLCNGIKSDKYFTDIQSAADYILSRRN